MANAYDFNQMTARTMPLLPIKNSLLNISAAQLQQAADDEFANAGHNFKHGFTHAARQNAADAMFLQSLMKYKV